MLNHHRKRRVRSRKEGNELQRTFVMIKPDAMQKGLIGEIFSRLEREGLKPVGVKMLRLDDEILDIHYAHHKSKPFFLDLKEFMKETPVIASVWEGENAIAKVREIIGATDPEKAAPGTIRNQFGDSIQRNLVHASDSKETAEAEIRRFFKEKELHTYTRKLEGLKGLRGERAREMRMRRPKL